MGSAITDPDTDPAKSEGFVGNWTEQATETLRSITAETEDIRGAVESEEGLTKRDGGETRQVSYPVVLVVTDQRILFVASDAGEVEADDAGSLSYEAVAGIDADGEYVSLTTDAGVTWQFPLPADEEAAVSGLVRDLRWIGTVRSRTGALVNDAELSAGQIRDCAEDGAWKDAIGTYERVREDLDALVGAVQRTTPVADEVLAPELTPAERRLEAAYARAMVERTRSQLTLGQQLIEGENFEGARSVLAEARASHDEAAAHAAEIRRGDGFQFGPQRELEERLAALSAAFDELATRPLRMARQARTLAETADDPEAALEDWEGAFRRYETVLAIEAEGIDPELAGDRGALRTERRTAGEALVDCHQDRASVRWAEGISAYEDNDLTTALEAVEAAIGHIDRARAVAAEVKPDAVDALDDRLAEMRRYEETLEEELEAASTPSADAVGGPVDLPTELDSKPPLDADALRELDTHHEITFDAEPADRRLAEGRHLDLGSRATHQGFTLADPNGSEVEDDSGDGDDLDASTDDEADVEGEQWDEEGTGADAKLAVRDVSDRRRD